MTEQIFSDLMVREPVPTELGRVLHLFRGARLPASARALVAVRTHPVERFIAALAWWPQGAIACFKLAIQPGIAAKAQVCGHLINRLFAGCQASGGKKLQYAELLPEDSDWIAILKENGFRWLRSERFFEVSASLAWHRTVELHDKFAGRIPPGWKTESIRYHQPEIIQNLIAPHRLMPPDEVADHWRSNAPQGFELDSSSILFDQTVPVGVMLARKVQSRLCIDIRVVQSDNRLLSSLGNIMLFYHITRVHGPNGIIRHLQFRGGETEHRETANLAFRMGGAELPPRHIFVKDVL